MFLILSLIDSVTMGRQKGGFEGSMDFCPLLLFNSFLVFDKDYVFSVFYQSIAERPVEEHHLYNISLACLLILH